MEKRRKIALVTAELENICQQRTMKGVFEQARKYNYDVAVFSTMVDMTHYIKDNLRGEMNIYQLINFSLFDGVIITPYSLFSNDDGTFETALLKMFTEKCHCKVVALDRAFGEYEVVTSDDLNMFYEIARHIYEDHGLRKVYFLGGDNKDRVSGQRLGGVLKYAKEHGFEFPSENVIAGDYWYTGGERLADEIIEGRREMPEAVICANDYMAIGLANRLKKHNIQIPGQIAITGYDVTYEAAFNDIFISSGEPPLYDMAVEAVDVIHRTLEPQIPCIAPEKKEQNKLVLGESCGCSMDISYWKKRAKKALLHQKHNWSEVNQNEFMDIGILLESYMSENVTGTTDYQQCFSRLYDYVYLLRPFGDFWLCLKENWLDLEDVLTEGYPEKMMLVMHSNNDKDLGSDIINGFSDEVCPCSFDTSKLLPGFTEGCNEASVYYFLPVHFQEETYGYVSIRCPLDQKNRIGYVHHNWIRIASNGLSMVRIKNRLFELSMRDSVTGLHNRRGLEEWLHQRMESEKTILVIMVDMDGLKYINDHFGHADGDFGLMTLADSLKEVTGEKELCARVGGDEFLLVGTGIYDEESVRRKMREIEESMLKRSVRAGKKYEITASMGYALGEVNKQMDFEELLEKADMDMYRNKRRRHKNQR